jgi:hypothetical protein
MIPLNMVKNYPILRLISWNLSFVVVFISLDSSKNVADYTVC